MDIIMFKQELLLVTGLSGAGKSLTMRALEDIGYYCIDNLPANMLLYFINSSHQKTSYHHKIAITVDIRSGDDFDEVSLLLNNKPNDLYIRLMFLDSDDRVLAHRYKETRRCHPLTIRKNLSTEQALKEERKLLSPLYGLADIVIDSGLLSPAVLRERIAMQFTDSFGDIMPISLISFGFKYGIPSDADLVFDVRCLPNPYYIPNLQHKTGMDSEVYDYVFNHDAADQLFEKLTELLDYSMPLYIKEGKSRLTVAIGCTGGKHRSVSFVRRMGAHLTECRFNVFSIHRDITRSYGK